MKIYFVRHGEGIDDIYNEFGGWSDRELSPKGVNLAFKLSKILKKIEKKMGKFDIIYTSPLKRSAQTAEILGSELHLPDEALPYLKERNTYGLLSGVEKNLAKIKYPKMIKSFNNGRYIPAAERYKDFTERVRILLDYLKKQQHKNIICVTHGHLITVIAEELIGQIRNRIGKGCIMGIDVKNDRSLELIETVNITFTNKIKKSQELKKFKID